VAHADDDNLVTACLSMIANLEADKRIVRKAAEFGIAHYFNHKHTTDYCSGCKPGDTMAAIVARAAGVYGYSGDYDKAKALIRRFLKSREKETSDPRLESLYASLGHSYWELGEHEKAVELLEKAYRRFGKAGKRSNLSYYLEQYRKQLPDAVRMSQSATPNNLLVAASGSVVSGPKRSAFPARIEGQWLGTFNPESRFTLSDGTRMSGIALNVKGQAATVSLVDPDELLHELDGTFSVRLEGESMTLSGYVTSANERGLWSVNVADMGLPDLHVSVTAMLTSSVSGQKVKRTATGKGTIARQ
jgi:tetratricopeptide (TPR) repeat protein